MVHIHPSLLAVDFLKLQSQLKAVRDADYLHVDIMDGHFVPNHTFGPHIVKTVKKIASIPLEFHMLILNPELHLDTYLQYGDRFIFHVETGDLHPLIKAVKKEKKQAGVSLNPDTPIDTLEQYIRDVDFVCLMSAHPGFSGQEFLEQTLTRIEELRKLFKEYGVSCEILLDGGVTKEVIQKTMLDRYVMGNSLFSCGSSEAIREQFLALQQL